MFSKILVATDGSETARAAVEHAAELARLSDSKDILIIHLCPACTADLDPDESNRKYAEKILSEAKSAFTGGKARITTKVEVDYPPESLGTAIVDYAGQEGADLIVLGSRGLSEFKGMLLGSVSSKVVQHATCPVLIVKTGQEET